MATYNSEAEVFQALEQGKIKAAQAMEAIANLQRGRLEVSVMQGKGGWAPSLACKTADSERFYVGGATLAEAGKAIAQVGADKFLALVADCHKREFEVDGQPVKLLDGRKIDVRAKGREWSL